MPSRLDEVLRAGQVAATGEMIYGNINGVPYKYSRVDGKHWTATGKKREAA